MKIDLIRTGVVNLIKDIKKSRGYLTNVVDAHVYPQYDQAIAENNEDIAYPKFFVVLDGGVSEPLPSSRSKDQITFVVIAVFKKIHASDVPGVMAENFIADMKAAIRNNNTLGNTVLSSWIERYSTDAGYLYPESTAVLMVSADYYE